MNRLNKILAFILALQIVLLAARALWPESESRASGEALLADFDTAAVTQLRISDGDGKQVVLKKDGDEWVLPDYGNYPALPTRVSLLLDKIKGLRTDRLITRSTTSHRRLRVSSDEFERLIEIEGGDSTHKLYLGKSGGGNTLHVRLDDQPQVYLVSGLAVSDAGVAVSSWINTLYFSVPSDQVISLRLQNANGTFEFTKSGDSWNMAGLAEGETLNEQALKTLLNQITALYMSAPIGKEEQADFGLDAPQATIILRVLEPEETPEPTPDIAQSPLMTATPDPQATPTATPTPQYVEKEYTVLIGATRDDGVVAKSSASDYYVLLTEAVADRFTQKTRADFITLPSTPTPEPTVTPGEAAATPAPMSTPVAPVTPPTPEPTATPAPTATAAPEAGS
ncbi:MAG: hypothetical protein KatS3mg051_1267 [Anaerolineae bacterium]|nr:MAG: hypothetical protein KatS3mg051_1267 [Anaerolineae bacterium]